MDRVDERANGFASSSRRSPSSGSRPRTRCARPTSGSSSKTEAQIGDIAAVPVDELKAWWRDGNYKKPFPMPKAVHKAFTPPKAKGPLSSLQFIASQGGLRPDPGGELKGLGFNNKSRVVIPGLGFRSVMRKDGMDLDEAREAAVEAGYLHDPGFEQQEAGDHHPG